MSRHAWIVSVTNASGGARMDIYQCHDCTANYSSWAKLADHYDHDHPNNRGRLAYVRGQADASVMSGVPQVLRCAAGHHDWAKWNWIDHVHKHKVDDNDNNKHRYCKRPGCRASEGRYDTPPENNHVGGPHGIGSTSPYKHPGGRNNWVSVDCAKIQCTYSVVAATMPQAIKRVTAHANDANINHNKSIAKLLKQVIDQQQAQLGNATASPW